MFAQCQLVGDDNVILCEFILRHFAMLHRYRQARVLSIQSHVVHGVVGNKSAVFPLQVKCCEYQLIFTLQDIHVTIAHIVACVYCLYFVEKYSNVSYELYVL